MTVESKSCLERVAEKEAESEEAARCVSESSQQGTGDSGGANTSRGEGCVDNAKRVYPFPGSPKKPTSSRSELEAQFGWERAEKMD